MNCPFCGSSQVMVINSRSNRNRTQIWRRRKCVRCGEVFTTYENVNLLHLIVIKKSGKKVRFNRAKLFSGIYHSLLDQKNIDRGDIGALAEKITQEAENTILKLGRKKVKSMEITEIVLGILKKRSPDTFLRFLAYREGKNKKKLKAYIRKFF